MPIEIRELRIRVAVNEPETQNTAAESFFAFGDGFLGGIDVPASAGKAEFKEFTITIIGGRDTDEGTITW